MSDRFRDFDAFWAEKEREPVTFRLFGEDWKLPPSLPAEVPLSLLRYADERGSDAEIGEAETFRIAERLLGKDTLEAISAKAKEQGRVFDVEQLGELVQWLMSQYTLSNTENGAAKEGSANGKGFPSSGTGRRSKRTSDGSTASNSRKK